MDTEIEKILFKFEKIKDNLNNYFIKREDVIDGILYAITIKKHGLLIGVPGVAKSYVLRCFSDHITGLVYWEYLLTPSTTEEEIMGNFSVKSRQLSDELKRNTENRLPKAQLAFCDEFFKAKAATLQSLLVAMSDGIFYNPNPEKIPLISLFGASNEKPGQGSELEALYDRFLLRYEIKRLSDINDWIRLANLKDYDNRNITVNLLDIQKLQAYCKTININDNIKKELGLLVTMLIAHNVKISERRFRWILELLRAVALYKHKDSVELEDFKYIYPALWTYSTDQSLVSRDLRDHLNNRVK